MVGYSLMTLVLVGVRCVFCNPTPLDELTINLNLQDTTEDEEKMVHETFDEDQEMKAGQITWIAPVVIGGYGSDGNFVQDNEYFGRTGKWGVMIYPGDLANRRSRMGVAAHKYDVYMAGGEDRHKILVNDVFQRSFFKKWDQISHLQNPRMLPTLSILEIFTGGIPKTTLLVTGGKDAQDRILKTTEIFSPETKTWVYGNPMSKARFGHAAVVLDNILHVFGGEIESNEPTESTETTESSECFVADQKWRECPPMKEKRSFHAATVLGNDIYVCGGYKYFRGVTIYLSSCEVDKNHTGFVPAAAMLTTRAKFGMVTMDGEVWAIGGENSAGKVLNTVEKFNPKTQKWTEHGENLLKPRKLFGATTILVDSN